jgi:hypothetical protein
MPRNSIEYYQLRKTIENLRTRKETLEKYIAKFEKELKQMEKK